MLPEQIGVFTVELKAVAVSFRDLAPAVGQPCLTVFREHTVIGAQSHGAAHVPDMLLIFHFIDHRMRGVRIHFRAMCVFQVKHIAGKLYGGHLQTQADTEKGDVVLPGVADGVDLSLRSSPSESRCHQDAVEVAQEGLHVRTLVEILRMDHPGPDAALIGGPGMDERFIDGLIGILKLHVFADHADIDSTLGVFHPAQEIEPAVELRLAEIFYVELLEHDQIEILLFELDRHIVDGLCIYGFYDRVVIDIAELGDLAFGPGMEVPFCPADQDIGLYTMLK